MTKRFKNKGLLMADKEKKKEVGVSLEQEQTGDGEKWVKYYSSNHHILLVGEGDFSFSLCVAQSFGSASNIVATSLDSHDDVIKKYKKAMSNLDNLQRLGASVLHEVDATKMVLHPDLKIRRFDRIIFNFPHAGFHGREDSFSMIKKHKELVLDFFMNARCMLRANGEIHVNHKTTAPFSKWNIENLAMQCNLALIECADFKIEDYPGYHNKRGDGFKCDKPFPLGKCSTFKFVYNPRARTNGYSPFFGGYSNNGTEILGRAGPVACYSVHGISPDLQRPLQWSIPTHFRYPQTDHVRQMNVAPLSHGARNELFQVFGGTGNSSYLAEALGRTAQSASCSLQPEFERYPVEVHERCQPWPTTTNIRYPQTDHVRQINVAPLSHGARNEPFQAFGGTGNSSYLAEALGRTTRSASYSLQPEFERYPVEVHERSQPWPTTTNIRYPQTDHVRQMNVAPLSHGARNEPFQAFGGTGNSSYLAEALGKTTRSASYSLQPEFEHERTWNDDIHAQRERHRRSSLW